MQLDKAQRVAGDLCKMLSYACTRIEVAGSVRREKAEPNDIELVAIPDPRPVRAQFGERAIYETELDRVLGQMRANGVIDPLKSGDKYKQFWMLEQGRRLVKVDLFVVTPPAQWGVIMMIRTGPADFSKWMVTQKFRGGALPDGFRVDGGRVINFAQPQWVNEFDQEPEPRMDEEQDFFRFCGVDWIEPRDRVPQWQPSL